MTKIMFRTIGLLRQRQNNIRSRLQFNSGWCCEEEIDEIIQQIAMKLLKLTTIINRAMKLANNI